MKSLLWEPFRLGKMELRNRIVMPPMVTRYADEQGYITERMKNYYEARAKGGAGLIIVEAHFVHQLGRVYPNQANISDDRCIPGLSALVQLIHKHGAKAAIQLHHCGRMTKLDLNGMQPVAPSALATPEGRVPKELTVEGIAEIVAHFAAAALRAKKAGFDSVELHGAHGYIIDQFLSRSTNRRKDEYGGNLEKRARFLVEIIKAIKEAAGKSYPVWPRINGKEYGVEQGTTLEEAQQIARMAEEAGADAIHVSAGGPTAPTHLTSATFVPAVIADLAEGIK